MEQWKQEEEIFIRHSLLIVSGRRETEIDVKRGQYSISGRSSQPRRLLSSSLCPRPTSVPEKKERKRKREKRKEEEENRRRNSCSEQHTRGKRDRKCTAANIPQHHSRFAEARIFNPSDRIEARSKHRLVETENLAAHRVRAS